MLRTFPRILIAAAAVAAAALGIVVAQGDGSHSAKPAAAKPLVDPEGTPAQVRRPNVLLLLMDEFTIDAILGPDGRIDVVRFPNFAGLAANSTWFPNAWSAYDSTPKAIPLILDGVRPREGVLPDARGHRRTLFDALGRRGYRIVSSEEATAVCPGRWCPNARRERPGILGNLNRGRIERLEGFFGQVRQGRRPTFWMKHTLLPHGPYQFLPSGARTRTGPKDPVPGMNSPRGFHDRFLTQHNEQRYLLQISFVDQELGKLLRRMIANKTFDRTLIVVVADHGIAWEVGVKDRRRVNERNVDEITPVPLFVKSPRQRRGRVDRSYVSTLDITPTIADILNVRLPYRADGRSALSRQVRRRRRIRLPTRDFSRIVRISARANERRRRANIRRRLALFGFGATGLYDRVGPHRQLVGRMVTSFRVRAGERLGARVGLPSGFRGVRRSTGVVPAQVAGDVRGGKRGQKRDVAIAINGRIEAVGRTFYLARDRTEHFAAMVPELALRDGTNRIEVFEVARGGVLRRLARL